MVELTGRVVVEQRGSVERGLHSNGLVIASVVTVGLYVVTTFVVLGGK